MKNQQNPIELLKDAYAVIDGVPEAAIALGAARSKQGKSLKSGTVCAPEGWLAQHPQFKKLGLKLSKDGKTVICKKEVGPAAIAQALGLSVADASALFGDKSIFAADTGASDKQLWLDKVRAFLKDQQASSATAEPAATHAPTDAPTAAEPAIAA